MVKYTVLLRIIFFVAIGKSGEWQAEYFIYVRIL